ncbi:MAG: prepilin peptidase [Pseudomonadota bacterium]
MTTDPTLLAPLLAGLTALICMVAAGYDVARFKIPNGLILSLCLVFVTQLVTGIIPFHALALHLLVGAVMFAVCFAMFAKNWLGAGDGKLLIILSLILGPSGTLPLVIITGLAGGLLALAIALLAARPLPVWLEGVGIAGGYQIGMRRVPYGVAIAVGAIAALAPLLTQLIR